MLHNSPIILSEKKNIAENTVELTFLVSDPNFAFKAGQYVSIEIPSLAVERVPDRCHDFSIASSPSNPKEISIAIRVSQSVFKTALLSLPVGAVVNIDGPKGVLTLPEVVAEPIIFVAGGIGITPLLSMIRFATETSSTQQITLLYCNSKNETTAYHEELLALEQKNPNFKMHTLLGTPDEKPFVPFIEKIPSANWYIVGAPGMVTAVKQILVVHGIIDTQIRIEEFTGYLSS